MNHVIFPFTVILLVYSFAPGDAEGSQFCDATLAAVRELVGPTRGHADPSCSTCHGRPGKRGIPGPPGPKGPVGDVGKPGFCYCDLSEIDDLREQVKALQGFCYAGISNGEIPLSRITTSSRHSHCPLAGTALNAAGAWCSVTNGPNEWVQVDLSTPTLIYGVATQGRNPCGCSQWVQTFRIVYGNMTKSMTLYKENGAERVRRASTWT